ncbi:MAG: hypothetical protein ACXWXT_16300, partial [Candidatus Binatia bacterium]
LADFFDFYDNHRCFAWNQYLKPLERSRTARGISNSEFRSAFSDAVTAHRFDCSRVTNLHLNDSSNSMRYICADTCAHLAVRFDGSGARREKRSVVN